MKQKKYLFTLAASMMLAVTGFTSCTIEDNPGGGGSEPEVLPEVVDVEFDEGSIVKNGTLQGTLNENYWVHEWRTMEEQFDGPANIIPDPANRDNRCVAVVVRSADEANAAGNAILDNGNLASWDSQFFITFGPDQALKDGDKIKLIMKVKGDADQQIDTQIHTAPGSYLGSFPLGNINVTTEWTTIESDFIAVADSPTPWWMGGKDAQSGFYTIAFNLAKGDHNTIYFDDIRVEVDRFDQFDKGNEVKNGTANKDNVSNFVANDFLEADGEQQALVPARIIADPADETNRCFVVGTNNNATNEWDAQFFITVPESQAFKNGDKIKLQMKIKADKAQGGVASQAHEAPGAYIAHGILGNLDFTTEWTDFEKEITVNTTMSPKGNFRTIAFNLSVKGAADGANKMYFDDIKLTCERAPEVEYEWIEVQINGDLEGDDVSGIACREKGMPDQYVIKNGIGKDGSRGTYVTSSDAAEQVWDSQFFVVLPEEYPEGTQYKFQMDVKADAAATVSSQTHNNPGSYIGGAFGNFNVTTDWTTIKGEGTFGSNNGALVKSFAFNLNEDKTLKTIFYFDNIKVWIAKEKK